MYRYNLHKLFNKTVQQCCHKTAIIADEGDRVSFTELDRLSNQMARWLLKQNAGKGKVIGILNTKKIESFALMIASLKLGAIYVNLDFNSPAQRLGKIIQKCEPTVVFYDDDNLEELASQLSVRSINLMSESCIDQLNLFSEDPLSNSETGPVCADNPAYIMFTSGSTGFPKGVIITHQNVLNFIDWTRETYEITTEDVFTNINPMFFDNSVFDFYASLFNGATMAAFSSQTIAKPSDVIAKVDQVEATIWFSVPSMLIFLLTMKVLSSKVFQSLRLISFGGEGFPKPKLKQVYDLFSDRIRFLNVYGPTECTCICSAYEISDRDFDNMERLAPIGFLADNFDYLIVNEDGKEADKGELLLGGPQVGLGYINDPAMTSKSFIQSPDLLNYKKVVYRTGDLFTREDDGMLHIQGRIDNQIKHMGYRIELEEVEAGFSTLDYVNEVGVIYESLGNDLGQITAFLKLNSDKSMNTIKNDIKSILPPYMVPRTIVVVKDIPKNNNGKIDRIVLKSIKK